MVSMSIDRQAAHQEQRATSASAAASLVGKQSRIDSLREAQAPDGVGKQTLVQRKERPGVGASATADTHAIANAGVAGGGGSLPFGDRIQASFGRHDVG